MVATQVRRATSFRKCDLRTSVWDTPVPYEIDFANLPVGYAETCSLAADETVAVRGLGIATSADGEILSTWLSGYPSEILEKIAATGKRISPTHVSDLLALIRADKTATVYVNELNISTLARVSPERVYQTIAAGDKIYDNDIVDIIRADIQGVDIPPDAGVILVCSVGWRKAMFFDLLPISPKDFGPRQFDIGLVLGQVFSQLCFQHFYGITDIEWASLFESKWFPFCGLKRDTLKLLLSAIRCARNADELLDRIRVELLSRVDSFVSVWSKSPAFDSHMALLEHAVHRFKEGDYISCTSILFPRIEGLLRSHHSLVGSGTVTQASLSTSAVLALCDRPGATLIPLRFQRYLRDVYFADFDPQSVQIDVSRNSVGHGVTSAASFDLKSAVLALLVCHQLYYSFPEGND